jgi:hypothetical protein
MLIKVTNKCEMGCSHCMEDSTPAGKHMTFDTFLCAVQFSIRMESSVWETGAPPIILLSGGECTEHPDIVKMIRAVLNRGLTPIIITNGMWLNDKELRESILRPEWTQLGVQVTNDDRFYPKAPPTVDDPRIIYVPKLTKLIPLGRASKRIDSMKDDDLPVRDAPTSFNMRSITRQTKSFQRAVFMQRVRAASGYAGHCSPSITEKGDVHIGETRYCWVVGNIYSTEKELTEATIAMKDCNRCGLEDKLGERHRQAIGLV